MKLIMTSFIAATAIASTASAMTAPTNVDNRAAAQDALGFVTQGSKSTVSASQLGLDARSLATRVGDQVNVYTFEGTTRPQDSSDIR